MHNGDAIVLLLEKHHEVRQRDGHIGGTLEARRPQFEEAGETHFVYLVCHLVPLGSLVLPQLTQPRAIPPYQQSHQRSTTHCVYIYIYIYIYIYACVRAYGVCKHVCLRLTFEFASLYPMCLFHMKAQTCRMRLLTESGPSLASVRLVSAHAACRVRSVTTHIASATS